MSQRLCLAVARCLQVHILFRYCLVYPIYVPSIVSSVCFLIWDKYDEKQYDMKCQVNVPVPSILALVERILMVNGSLPQMSFPFMTSTQQENICSELPVLHLSSMELLMAALKGSGRYDCMISLPCPFKRKMG